MDILVLVMCIGSVVLLLEYSRDKTVSLYGDRLSRFGDVGVNKIFGINGS